MARKIQITNYLTRVLSDCVHIFSAGLKQQQKKQIMGYLTEPKCMKIARLQYALMIKNEKSADKSFEIPNWI
jgi:hypothetical protein